MTARVFALVLALLVAGACSGDQARDATHAAILGAGTGVAALRASHAAAYRSATDRLIADLEASGGTRDDYRARVVPLDAAFAARGAVLRHLTETVYGAAALLDATRGRGGGDLGAYRTAAAELLAGLEGGLAALRRGDALPPLAVPAYVTDVLAQLRALVGAAGGLRDAR